MGLFKRKIKQIEPEEMLMLEKQMEEQGIRAVPVNPEMKDILEKGYRKQLEALKEIIKTPEDKKLYKIASMVAFKEGWLPTRTYDAMKLEGEDKFKEIYQRAKANKMEILDETRLELCPPQQREQVLKDAKEYSIPINQMAEFYTLLPNVSDKLKKAVFEHAGKFKRHPIITLNQIAEEMEKRKK